MPTFRVSIRLTRLVKIGFYQATSTCLTSPRPVRKRASAVSLTRETETRTAMLDTWPSELIRTRRARNKKAGEASRPGLQAARRPASVASAPRRSQSCQSARQKQQRARYWDDGDAGEFPEEDAEPVPQHGLTRATIGEAADDVLLNGHIGARRQRVKEERESFEETVRVRVGSNTQHKWA